ncbi:Uncharacterised protein [Mycobacteroides abscessus subsp. abscessus]|nr:Uncharacterised protein [Mycobacteroides abscessus]CPZ84720.1 Uncharacterised protein [Mycobacteroides abscessus]SIN46163.1 Uncharacterised protein [Mycobacteroides abscessus subsp. abscessus]SKR28693.1 Uncharacterised protein [Mycobacteroides abscessus subsp. abscessus]SKX44714.1 Uncharacterised protein [Mycobacteroides abscessus subsp. abscessus]
MALLTPIPATFGARPDCEFRAAAQSTAALVGGPVNEVAVRSQAPLVIAPEMAAHAYRVLRHLDTTRRRAHAAPFRRSCVFTESSRMPIASAICSSSPWTHW